jgi:Zn-dependent M16 (insulinase) family peptidase
LRKLNNSVVKKYHTSYYRPDNINIIITGQIKIEEIIDSLEKIEIKILSKNIEYPKEK